MTSMSSFILYFCYEEFFKVAADEQELIQQISRYDGYSILYFILRLNTELLIWNNGVPVTSPQYLNVVKRLLPNILGETLVYELSYQPKNSHPSRALFHTRQLLYLAKLALRHCPLGSGLLFGHVGIEAGLILLKVNDQLHIKNRSAANNSDIETRDYALLSEFIAVNEFTGSNAGDITLRAYQMLFELSFEAKNKPFFMDLNEIFATQTGIGLEQYFAMCFSLFVSTNEGFYKQMDSALTFAANTWAKSSLPPKTIQAFWNQVSLPAPSLKAAVANDYGNNDVTVFRKWPLIEHNNIRFGFDSSFFMEKLWAGPYWTIFFSSEEAKQKMPQFTGWLFERYLNRLFTQTCGKANKFIPEPQKTSQGHEELADAMVVCGDALVLIEYKGVMFTAEAKYSGNWTLLRKEIEKKLVRNERGRPKGVSQLKNAIEYLNTSDLRDAVKDIDLSGIRTIYPLLVTLEPLGDGLIVSRILHREFEKLRTVEVVEKFTVKRLHCTGAATIEQICGAFQASSIAQLLDEWDQADLPLRGSWKMYFDPQKHETSKNFNRVKFEQLENRIIPLLQLRD